MLDARPNLRVAALLAAAALPAVACTLRHDTGTANHWRTASAGIAAKAHGPAVGTDVSVEDSALTVKVREAILADPLLQSQGIAVTSADATITLTGTVDTPFLDERAVDLAGSVAGVVQVDDRLDVRF